MDWLKVPCVFQQCRDESNELHCAAASCKVCAVWHEFHDGIRSRFKSTIPIKAYCKTRSDSDLLGSLAKAFNLNTG